ncbi:hypothetical protein H5J25_12940 [Sphingomonas aliaeris]|uniref:Uncharacterized protein n=1 Tax=Sphingomonas aliaeris TaxID=2759526 RepID=A0A974S3D0_9SPHN|nr:hypothetical protein [Sphingomonas aliaeris]QQV76378.1 hypothetical protein H5J25_12940 [Sphingomonas aliaeris]
MELWTVWSSGNVGDRVLSTSRQKFRHQDRISLWIKRLGVVVRPMPKLPANDTTPQWSFTVWNMRHIVARWCGLNLKRGWGLKPVAQACLATGVVTHGLRVFIDDEDEAVHFWMKWADFIA